MSMTPSSRYPRLITASDILVKSDACSSTEGDCDCACAEISTTLQPYTLSGGLDSLYRRGTSLNIQRLDENYSLAFNPLSSGGVIVLNNLALEILDAFKSPLTLQDAFAGFPQYPKHQASQVINKMINSRFLYPGGETEGPILQTSKQLTVWLHVTNECNLRCSYCYLRKTQDEMSPDIAKRALKTVFRTAEKHKFERIKLKYAGGEATLNFHRIIELHQHAQTLLQRYEMDLDEVVLSNGVGITDSMIDMLKTNNIRLMISLDGIGEYHDTQRIFVNGRGSFTIVAKTIDRLLQKGLIPHISITISDKNIDGLPQTVAFVLECDLPFSLNFYRENDCSATFQDLRFGEQRMVEGMRRAFQVIERNLPKRSLLGSIVDKAQLSSPHNQTCGVGNSYLVIDQNGKIAKCHMEIEKPITDINADDPLQIIRDDQIGIQNLNVQEKEGCRDCEWKYWCTGGCPLATYRATGRYDVKSPNCNIYKALYPEVLRLEGLRLLKYSANN